MYTFGSSDFYNFFSQQRYEFSPHQIRLVTRPNLLPKLKVMPSLSANIIICKQSLTSPSLNPNRCHNNITNQHPLLSVRRTDRQLQESLPQDLHQRPHPGHLSQGLVRLKNSLRREVCSNSQPSVKWCCCCWYSQNPCQTELPETSVTIIQCWQLSPIL